MMKLECCERKTNKTKLIYLKTSKIFKKSKSTLRITMRKYLLGKGRLISNFINIFFLPQKNAVLMQSKTIRNNLSKNIY